MTNAQWERATLIVRTNGLALIACRRYGGAYMGYGGALVMRTNIGTLGILPSGQLVHL